ncbi:protein-L-isoaspartate(D-aspartate) O-methyltransferase [Xanthocytophaga agilis]|uniref:Protein-L-isoaspartate O-methyltransferase n=1 Tax=Xanthocytophaga agilis TaxID=3048010 RepID=A0AAE3UEE7_9BACT|nr:protein-L-isoaspartate(D-aspartate) O-methyltransferase [Xanthocytophaga agilis]MDJ1502155.1 protein-L-isoaspartate(D-aspartate) O-methyltransferase [Xanthocytophaga agilis]
MRGERKKTYDSEGHKALRKELINSLTEKGITSSEVLEAIERVPRHFFVPIRTSPEDAYADHALQIGEGQTISQPYTVAYQTQLLDIKEGNKILEIGTGSGYQAAVLYQWPIELYTIELNQTLYQRTKELFDQLNYSIHIFLGDGSLGLPTYAPFDRILVTAGAPSIPEDLLHQLSPGGKLVIPVGQPKTQKMYRITCNVFQQFDTEIFDLFSFVPLLGKYGWK